MQFHGQVGVSAKGIRTVDLVNDSPLVSLKGPLLEYNSLRDECQRDVQYPQVKPEGNILVTGPIKPRTIVTECWSLFTSV